VDSVADLQDDIQEQMQIQEEVADILGQSAALDDEDELEDELNELMMEDEEETLVSEVTSMSMGTDNIASNTINTGSLPSAPEGSVQTEAAKPVAEDEDEIALRELQAEMAM